MSVTLRTAHPHRLLTPITQLIATKYRSGEKICVIVPEQMTLLMENAIISALGTHGFLGLEVLSPSRLLERILEETGTDDNEPLQESGQRMVLSQAMEQLDQQLPYYGALAHSPSFIEKISILITSLQQGGLSAETFSTYVQDMADTPEKRKYVDIAKIYCQYRTVLENRFADEEDRYTYMAKRMPDSTLVADAFVYIYGFDALTQPLIQLISVIAPYAKDITLALACDTELAIYQPILQSVTLLKQTLLKQQISLHVCPETPRPLDAHEEIQYLDTALFAYRPKPYEKETEAITLFSALDPFEEANIVARLILEEQKKGKNIERMAVLYPSEGYTFVVESALHSADIPYVTDSKLQMVEHPLVRFILLAMRAITWGYRSEDVFAMMKTGYSTLTFAQCCSLEHYAIQYGINQKRWTQPFTRGDENVCKANEELRVRLLTPLFRLREAIVQAKTNTDSLVALFSFLNEVNAYQTLAKEEEALLEKSLYARANQTSQVWEAIVQLFEQLHRIVSPNRIPLKYFYNRLLSGFSALQVATLPTTTGTLMVGAVDHILLADVDIVFILGLNDAMLTRETQSLFSEEEQQKVQNDTQCFLGYDRENLAQFAKLSLKKAMTLPKEKLYISYAKASSAGQALRPLSLLATLEKQMKLTVLTDTETLPLTNKQALSELGELFRTYEGKTLPLTWQNKLEQLMQDEESVAQLHKLLHTFTTSPSHLSPKQASRVFGEQKLSISRLENYAECPYRHFMTYGLRPEIVKEWQVDAIDTGNFYHDALHHFANLAKKNQHFPYLSDADIIHMADEAIVPLLEKVLSGPLGDGQRNQARLALAQGVVRRSALSLTKQVACGEFSIVETEASFGFPGGLPPIVHLLADGREIMLRGRIDRIDRLDTEDSVYLRVMDYKSSAKDMEAARTWWGLQLQLLLYLDVCMQTIPNSKPAGVFYFHVSDPIVESESDVVDVVEKLLSDKFQLKGIVLQDVDILQAMDQSETNYVLPSVFTKKGELRSNAKTLDEPQFRALIEHAREKATALANEVFRGAIPIAPVQKKEGTQCCDYCDYHDICLFSKDKLDCRELPDMKMDDLREKLM